MDSYKLYPESKRPYYFFVLIYKNVLSMQKAMHHKKIKKYKDTMAAVDSITNRHRLPTIGYIYFNKEKLTPYYIAHEAVHAAGCYADVAYKMKQFPITRGRATKKEEKFCQLVGDIVLGINQCIKLNNN